MLPFFNPTYWKQHREIGCFPLKNESIKMQTGALFLVGMWTQMLRILPGVLVKTPKRQFGTKKLIRFRSKGNSTKNMNKLNRCLCYCLDSPIIKMWTAGWVQCQSLCIQPFSRRPGLGPLFQVSTFQSHMLCVVLESKSAGHAQCPAAFRSQLFSSKQRPLR